MQLLCRRLAAAATGRRASNRGNRGTAVTPMRQVAYRSRHRRSDGGQRRRRRECKQAGFGFLVCIGEELLQDRKSTRLNSSHLVISYAVFCLKKKKCSRSRARTP